MTRDMAYYTLLNMIVNRANQAGIAQGERITQIMDLDNAAKQFNMRLEEMLEASDYDFAHDFIGIQNTMNRETGKIEGLFVPRFAGREEEGSHEQL